MGSNGKLIRLDIACHAYTATEERGDMLHTSYRTFPAELTQHKWRVNSHFLRCPLCHKEIEVALRSQLMLNIFRAILAAVALGIYLILYTYLRGEGCAWWVLHLVCLAVTILIAAPAMGTLSDSASLITKRVYCTEGKKRRLFKPSYDATHQLFVP